jgi:hypothetical protein
VYWSSTTGNAILRMPKGGGAPSVVVSTPSPTELVVDGQQVYWLNGQDVDLKSAPASGGAETVLTQQSSYPSLGTWQLSGLKQNTSSLFFQASWYIANPGPGLGPRGGFAVFQVSKSGGAPVRPWGCTGMAGFACALPSWAIDDTYLYTWSCEIGGLYQALNATALSTAPSFTLSSFNLSTGDDYPFPEGPMVVDGHDIYFYYKGLVESHVCAGTTQSLLLDVTPTMLAVDPSYVYWSDGSMLSRVPR